MTSANTNATQGPTKASAIAFRVAAIEGARRRRWVSEYESRSEFEAGIRDEIRLNSFEIEALEALPDDAPSIAIRLALSRAAGRPEYAKIDGGRALNYYTTLGGTQSS